MSTIYRVSFGEVLFEFFLNETLILYIHVYTVYYVKQLYVTLDKRYNHNCTFF